MKKTSVPMVPILCSYIVGIISTSLYIFPMWTGTLCCIIGLGYFTLAKKTRDLGIIIFFIFAGNLLYQTSETTVRRSPLPDWIEAIRESCDSKIDQLFSSHTHSTIVKALLLGDKKDMSRDDKFLFTESGTIHLMAVSGLHVGAIFFLSLLLLTSLRFPRSWGMLISLIGVWLYAFLSGLAPSTVRAATLLSLISIANVTQIIYNPINLCAGTALIALLFSPRLLFSLSFQLSYLAYFGIIIILPLVEQFNPFKQRWRRYLVISISISAITQLCTAPLLLYQFNHLPLNGIFVNLIAIPIATIILYSIIITMLLPTTLAIGLAMLCEWLINILLWLLKPFAKYGFTYSPTTSFDLWEISVFFAFIIVTILFWKTRNKIFYYIAILSLFPCSYLLFSHRKSPSGTNYIFFNTGYVPSLLIQEGKQCYLLNSKKFRPTQVVTYLNNKQLELHDNNDTFLSEIDNICIYSDTTIYRGQSIIICDTDINPQIFNYQYNNNKTPFIILTQTQQNTYLKEWQKYLSKKQINNIYVENNQIKRLKQSEIFR